MGVSSLLCPCVCASSPGPRPLIHRSSFSQTTRCSFSQLKMQRVALTSKTLVMSWRSSFVVHPCSFSSSSASSADSTPPSFHREMTLRLPFLDLLDLDHVTPISVLIYGALFSISIFVAKTLVNPFFWMYFSMTWNFWPWILAASLTIYAIYCLRKYLDQNASTPEQLVIAAAAFAWLTLIPFASLNGFLATWPSIFFVLYYWFFFTSARCYGEVRRDFYSRDDIGLPNYMRILFASGLILSHWFAAAETPGFFVMLQGWANLPIWIMIALCTFMQYDACFYLSKYTDESTVPNTVLQFGIYRWIRHPMYASNMLLFASYFIALRSPLSLLFFAAFCIAYYEQKTKLEERLMLESFGPLFKDYAEKVKYKFIPKVY